MDLIGMYGTSAATANNVASVQVPRRGTLRGISWSIWADLDADLEQVLWELSLVPVIQALTNNTRNAIWTGALSCNFTTSGSQLSSANGFVPHLLALDPLQILYLNVSMTGTASASVNLILHFQ